MIADVNVLIDDGMFNEAIFADPIVLIGWLMMWGHVKVVAHHHGVPNDAPLFDVGAEADDAAGDFFRLNDRPFAKDRLSDFGLFDFGSGQKGGTGVDRIFFIIRIETLSRMGQDQIRLIVRGHGADVFPVSEKHIGRGLFSFYSCMNEMVAEIIPFVVFEKGDERLPFEHIDAHRTEIRRIFVWFDVPF